MPIEKPEARQCESWLKVISNLRVDRKGSIAPHKPLLLLVVAELAEQGRLIDSILSLTVKGFGLWMMITMY